MLLCAACSLPRTTLPAQESEQLYSFPSELHSGSQALITLLPPTRGPDDPILTPTPNAPLALPTARTEAEQYVVLSGDTLGRVATLYGVSVEAIMQANGLANPDVLSVGQVLTIPAPLPGETGPAFKIIPDSELVNGPVNAIFNLEEYVRGSGGYLASYHEDLEGEFLSGAQIVARVANFYSVSPRLLLAALEHQGGWLTNAQPSLSSQGYPIGNRDPLRAGLYKQLAWAADNLNRGYYLWRAGGVANLTTADGVLIPVDATINAGTAGVQHFFAQLYDEGAWRQQVSENGFFATYQRLFGYPFDWAIEPLMPAGLTQPGLQLPFESGLPWIFTGGPHGGWDNGSAWAALDFAPSGEQLGCVQSNAWVAAAADGPIVRVENGAVVQDLDGDGYEQTGWTILYMHIETRDRVQEGAYLQAGERIGHPSCEGGFSSGTHLHLARRYNGEWIPADTTIPFVMDGWVSTGTGIEYDGYMQRGERSVEACECRNPENMLQR
jgi:murein DD-endopeptidase MepM/ murein hydrolase activator NlpD